MYDEENRYDTDDQQTEEDFAEDMEFADDEVVDEAEPQNAQNANSAANNNNLSAFTALAAGVIAATHTFQTPPQQFPQNPPQNFQQQSQQNFQQQISTLNLEGKLKENFLKREGRINRLNFFKKFLIMFGVAFVIILAVLPLDLFAEIISSSVLKTIHEIFIKAESVLITIILPYGVIVRRSHDLPTDNLFAKFLANDDEFVARIMTGLMIAAQLLGIINMHFKEISDPARVLLILFDIVYLIFWLYLVFKKGATGANQFGAEPVN